VLSSKYWNFEQRMLRSGDKLTPRHHGPYTFLSYVRGSRDGANHVEIKDLIYGTVLRVDAKTQKAEAYGSIDR
jgi:hypothetical protein